MPAPNVPYDPKTHAIDPQMFRLMAEQAQDYAIFLLDPEGVIASWNAGAMAIKQYRPEEAIGRHFSMFYTAADIERGWPAQELRRAAMDGRFEDEGWRVRRDGSRFWANVVITALRSPDGRLLAFSKITRDITERKLQEERLRSSEERFRLLVDGVQDYAIYMLDPDGQVSSWNMGARRITGYEAVEAVGRHFSMFYPDEAVKSGRPWAELAIARQHGRAEDTGWRVRKDGTRFWARVVVTALYDSEGHPRGFAKVTQDMTGSRHTAALEENAAQVSDFIAVLAHELRNPLAPIRNAAHLLRLNSGGDPMIEKVERIIERQSGQLSRIVDDLLDISRVSRGTLTMEMRDIDLAAVISRAIETSRPVIEASGHTLVIEMPEGALPVRGDEVRLAQALTNILNNAARYTDPGGRIILRAGRGAGEQGTADDADGADGARGAGAGTGDAGSAGATGSTNNAGGAGGTGSMNNAGGAATANSRQPANHAAATKGAAGAKGAATQGAVPANGAALTASAALIHHAALTNNAPAMGGAGGAQAFISVRDTGRGIEPGLLGAIFGMFVQGRDALQRPAAGLGVGLALARSIVEMHHGGIEALSEGPGRGAEFVLTLPLTAHAVPRVPAATPAERAPPAPQRRVLVVDDNEDAAAMLALLVRSQGHEALVVNDGAQALRAFEGFRPQVVLMDLAMPGMDGLEAARRMRERNRRPRPLLVAITGYGHQEDRAKTREAGFDLHLVKPVDEQQLHAVLASGAVSSPA